MGIFGRIKKISEAHLNNIADNLEDPELMLDQAIRDKEKQLSQAKQAVITVMATAKGSEKELKDTKKQQEDWEQKAKIALKAGNEELATKALVRSEEYAQSYLTLAPSVEMQKKDADGLKINISQLEAQVDELKRKRNVIVAQAKTAEVKKNINQARAKLNTSDTDSLIERMQNKVSQNNLEAEAAGELAEMSGDQLEKEFSDLNATQASDSVKSKLELLKSQL